MRLIVPLKSLRFLDLSQSTGLLIIKASKWCLGLSFLGLEILRMIDTTVDSFSARARPPLSSSLGP